MRPHPSLDEAVRTYRAHYARDSSKWTEPYPGVRNCLDFARARGMHTAVASNKGEAVLRSALENLGILESFDLVLGEQADLPPKPAADIVEIRIRPSFGQAGDKALFVGDTPADLEFASHAGIDSCWAAYGHGNPEICRTLRPRFEINNFHELQRLPE